MKNKFSLLAILTITFCSVRSQVIQPPNDTFQNWTVTPLAPDGWCTYSSVANFDLGLSSKDVNAGDSYFGLTSIKLISDSIGVEPAAGVVGGLVSLGTGTLNTPPAAPTFSGIPFSYLPDTVYAIYQYSTPGADAPTAYILMTDIVADTSIDTTITVADTTYATVITKADTAINVTYTTVNDTAYNTMITPADTTMDTTIVGTDTTFNTIITKSDTSINVSITAVVDTSIDTIITPADTAIQSTITTADTIVTTTPSLVIDTIISAGAYLPVPESSSSFVLGIFPITGSYLDANTPDTLLLQFCSSWETLFSISSSQDTTTVADTLQITTQYDTSIVQAPAQGSTLILSQVFFGYVTLPTGLQQIADKMDFTLYPNPTANTLNISSAENASGFKVLVSDMNGNLVFGGSLNDGKTSIAVQSFAAGMYVCRIADRSGNILKQDKFIVTR